MPVEEQVVVLLAGTRGYLDNIPVSDVLRFEAGLLEHFKTRHQAVLDDIVTSGAIADEPGFERMIKEFADGFETSDGSGPAPEAQDAGTATTDLVDADDTLPEEEITADEA